MVHSDGETFNAQKTMSQIRICPYAQRKEEGLRATYFHREQKQTAILPSISKSVFLVIGESSLTG